jgi:hypothetical protein
MFLVTWLCPPPILRGEAARWRLRSRRVSFGLSIPWCRLIAPAAKWNTGKRAKLWVGHACSGLVLYRMPATHNRACGPCPRSAASTPGKLLAPKVLEPCRRQLGVAHRVLDVFVPEVGLERPRVMAGVGKRIAAGVPQHVGMDLEFEPGLAFSISYDGAPGC